MTEQEAAKLERLCDDKRTEYIEALDSLEQLQEEKTERETDISKLSAKKETLEKEVAAITDTHNLVTSEANRPIPVFGKADEIKDLRIKNALLQKKNKENEEAIRNAREDNGSLFRELKSEQKRREMSDLKADRNAKAASEAEEIKSVFPTEYAELLRRTRLAKSSTNKKAKYDWGK